MHPIQFLFLPRDITHFQQVILNELVIGKAAQLDLNLILEHVD